MRIMIVSHAFPPYIGGLSYVVENLSTRLAARGFDVEVVTLDVDGNLPREEEYRGVCVKRFRGCAPDRGYFIPSPDFYKYLNNRDADLFHLHNIGALTVPVAHHALKRDGKSYVITPHYHRSGYKWHAKALWRAYRPVARRILQDARVVHSVSNYEASLVKRVFGVDSIVIPNGVSEDVFEYRWSPSREVIVLTYAGRLERYKRIDLIIMAAHILKQRGYGSIVVKIIGEGPDAKRICKLAERCRVNILWRGFLSRRKYLEELAGSTIFINASQYEAYSIVSAEAIAIGVPTVIVKPWGEHFRGFNNIFVVDPSAEKIANAIEKILSGGVDENQESTERPEIPSWNTVVDKLIEEVYARATRH